MTRMAASDSVPATVRRIRRRDRGAGGHRVARATTRPADRSTPGGPTAGFSSGQASPPVGRAGFDGRRPAGPRGPAGSGRPAGCGCRAGPRGPAGGGGPAVPTITSGAPRPVATRSRRRGVQTAPSHHRRPSPAAGSGYQPAGGAGTSAPAGTAWDDTVLEGTALDDTALDDTPSRPRSAATDPDGRGPAVRTHGVQTAPSQ